MTERICPERGTGSPQRPVSAADHETAAARLAAWVEADGDHIYTSPHGMKHDLAALVGLLRQTEQERDEAVGGTLGPVEVTVNGQRYVREETLFAAMRELDGLRAANERRDSQMKRADS